MGGACFIVGWWLLGVKFLVHCLLERILALMAYILLELFVPFEIF
jgi:membrane protein implicated in regulation of membrane protease activity